MGTILLNQVEPVYEPREKVTRIIDECDFIEMTKSESGFLCGLLKKYHPQKILEVGVAAGGTTAIIKQCIRDLGLHDTEIHSIDIDGKYYRDPSKETGYIAERQNLRDVNHTFYFGKIAYDFIEEIGKGIDFLILDTVHRLPGEILDIVTVLPFMKVGGVIVLHDIAYNQYSDVTNGYATGVVFSNLVGDKYVSKPSINITDEFKKERISATFGEYAYPNIGAVVVSEETIANVNNLFLAMITSWAYLPDKSLIDSYRNAVVSLYNKDLVWIFEQAIEMNTKTVSNQLMNKSKSSGKVIVKRKIKSLIHKLYR